MPTSESRSRTDNTVLIGVTLAAVFAILILLGATIFKSGEQGAGPSNEEMNVCCGNPSRLAIPRFEPSPAGPYHKGLGEAEAVA